MEAFVVVATFQHIHETVIIRARLESEGIPTLVRNETLSYLVPMFGLSNKRIKLVVNAEDEIRAREILSATGYDSE